MSQVLRQKNVQLLLLNCGFFKSIGYLAVSMINSWTELIDCVTSIIKFLWGARLQRSRTTGHITKSWVKCSLFEKVLSEIFTAHWMSFSLETTNVNIWSIFIHEKQKSRSVKYLFMEMKPTRKVREVCRGDPQSHECKFEYSVKMMMMTMILLTFISFRHASSTKVRFYLYFTSAFTTQKLMLSFSASCNSHKQLAVVPFQSTAMKWLWIGTERDFLCGWQKGKTSHFVVVFLNRLPSLHSRLKRN